MRHLFFLMIVFLALPFSGVYSQDTLLINHLEDIEQLEGEDFRHGISQFYDSISKINNYQTKSDAADLAFELTLKKDEIAHIHSLLFRAMLTENPDTRIFEMAYKLAKKHQRTDDINHVEYSRARFYLARKQYDSAMIHLMEYRDRTPVSMEGEGYRNIINLMGDIYYHARLYDQAEEIYSDLYERYKQKENWNFYRPYVMMNNLGQIALNSGKYEEAGQWFRKSLSLAEQHLQTPYRINTLAYTKIKLAETAIETDSLQLAEALLKEVANYPRQNLHEDVVQDFIFNRSHLLLRQGMTDDALDLALHLAPGDSMRFVEYRNFPDIYQLLSEIYSANGDHFRALQYNNRYMHIADSLKDAENLAASMIILADYNHQLTRLELKKTKQKTLILIIGLLILTAILFVMLILYLKLYRSKLELVRKSLSTSKSPESPVIERKNGNGTDTKNKENNIQQKQIIKALRELMDKKQPYLNPGIGIQEVAKQLSTNRTYLSKAINNQLKTTFPNFINQYRIKESIHLIITGYTTNHTQEALSRQAGFSSRTVFITAFKKHTGVTPSFFIKNYEKQEENLQAFIPAQK